jgi:hypothetical protein
MGESTVPLTPRRSRWVAVEAPLEPHGDAPNVATDDDSDSCVARVVLKP